MTESTMEKYFGKGGALAGFLQGFEPRAGQQEMAEAVKRNLEQGSFFSEDNDPMASILVAEAETGIGKTLAYLIPSLLSGKKIVVSTATINLQDQILKKEVPLLEELFGEDLNCLCVKGRQNYLCHHRWYQHQSSPQASLVRDEQEEKIERWLETTETGDRAELDWLPDYSPLWNKIASNSSRCLGSDCSESSYCFVSKLRKNATKARLLIVNHHLLFSDLALRKGGHGEVLPRYEAVVFDEAHHIENVATSFFGKSFSHYQVLDLLADIEQQAEADMTAELFDKFAAELSGVRQRMEAFTQFFPPKKGRYPLPDLIEDNGAQWHEQIELLSSALCRLGEKADKNSAYSDSWRALSTRAFDLDKLLHEVSLAGEEPVHHGYVHWYERRERSVVISATPVHVAGDIEQTLYRTLDSCIFTSATLSAGGSFEYLRQRLGLPETTEYLQLSSPFDYAGRTRLYVPESSFPEPASPNFLPQVCEKVEQLINLVGGRTLVLFTSFRGMDAVAEYLEARVEYPVFVQGSLPRKTLLEKFAAETDSVLLAVASFWEGVDVQGESLSCVVIDKLPFEVPSDPVLMARVDEIQAKGGKPFFDFQIPRAVLSLKQGVGRLMRSSSDRGIIAILDVRLFSKGYGRTFRKSLPPSPVVRKLDGIEGVLLKDKQV